jgi:chromate transporter
MREFIELFWIFFKIGLFTFGGGYAMIPMLKEVLINKKHWITEDEMVEVLAIAESTPGPAAVNLATFLGYKKKKILGATAATIGVVLPSFIIIILVSLILAQFENNKYVKYAFVGINAAVAMLILYAGLGLVQHMKKNPISLIIAIGTLISFILVSILGGKFSSIYYILIGGAIGLIYYTIDDIVKKKHKKLNTQQDESNDESLEDGE